MRSLIPQRRGNPKLTTLYHRAFEHIKFHNREPPPKEILEDETARGSDTLNRTVENYVRRGAKDDAMANGVGGSQDSGNDGDRMELDDPGSVRATRGMRRRSWDLTAARY